MVDNSLLREHDGLILDLAVQGQDEIIDERALRWGETKDAVPSTSARWGQLRAPRELGGTSSNLCRS